MLKLIQNLIPRKVLLFDLSGIPLMALFDRMFYLTGLRAHPVQSLFSRNIYQNQLEANVYFGCPM